MDELIRKAKKGDREAFTEAILLIQDDLFNYAYARVNNIEDANDILQETILHAFKHIKKLKEEKYFKTWIIRILINQSKQHFREKYKHNKILEKVHEEMDWSIDNIENKVDLENKYDFILRKLKPIEQTIIILHYGNKYTRKEIAEILNIKEETVKTKLRRIKIKIEQIKSSRKGDK